LLEEDYLAVEVPRVELMPKLALLLFLLLLKLLLLIFYLAHPICLPEPVLLLLLTLLAKTV
jgi:hypothetical protein